MNELCRHETHVIRAVVEDQWTDALREHVAGCDNCAAAAAAAPFMKRLAQVDERQRKLPDPAVVWLKAQLLRGGALAERAARLSLSICALLLSWLLIHTLFAFHYARCYYWREEPSKEHIRGLRFPGQSEPDYLDFVYYSFVVGMTCQVSDVAVVARHMRRITLIHGVLSFVFNIAILAMSINIIGGMI